MGYNGSEVPQGQNRQTINLAQKWVLQKWVSRHWPEVAQKWVQSGFQGLFLHKIGPEAHFGPTFGPLPANDEKPIFGPLLCQINCLTILALRDLRFCNSTRNERCTNDRQSRHDQMHLSPALKAVGSLISLMSWEWTNRNEANRHLELPGHNICFADKRHHFAQPLCGFLATRPKYPPPCRETGVAIPLSHCISCDIADYRCYTPTSLFKNGLSQPKGRPNKKGVSQSKLNSEAYRAIGGVARNSIANCAIVEH